MKGQPHLVVSPDPLEQRQTYRALCGKEIAEAVWVWQVLPDLPKLMKFWCETQGMVCKHGRFATEMCVKCGRWHWLNANKPSAFKPKYDLDGVAGEQQQ